VLAGQDVDPVRLGRVVQVQRQRNMGHTRHEAEQQIRLPDVASGRARLEPGRLLAARRGAHGELRRRGRPCDPQPVQDGGVVERAGFLRAEVSGVLVVGDRPDAVHDLSDRLPVHGQHLGAEQRPVRRRDGQQEQAAAEPLGIKREERLGGELELRLVIVQHRDHAGQADQ
jgi:hypothetical protein